jgi:hypothetical protein
VLIPVARQRDNVVGMNVRYGEWLVEESERVGVPWLSSRPWPTLAIRLTSALGISASDRTAASG